MGTYLSKPVIKKNSIDESANNMAYGVSSMQGWRLSQEDAHNALLNFSENQSLFAVYDGHGGEEVAAYTAAHFPNLLKDNLKSIEDSEIEKYSDTLVKSFLEFDSKLVEPDILKIIQEMAQSTDDSDTDEGEVESLCEEATMPIELVMEKYAGGAHIEMVTTNSEDSTSKASGSGLVIEEASNHKDCPVSEESDSSTKKEELKSIEDSDSSTKKKELKSIEDSDSSTKKEELKSIEDSDSSTKKEELKSIEDSESKEKNTAEYTSSQESESSQNGETAVNENTDEASTDTKDNVINGDTEDDQVKKGKGKGHSKGKNILSAKEVELLKKSERIKLIRAVTCKADSIYERIRDGEQELSDDDDTDDEDVQIETGEEEECSEEEDESSNNEESGEEVEESYEDSYSKLIQHTDEEPCYDSGCTACVALLKNDRLYVANVGDSRCVVYRDGQAIDMSVDHKPEDTVEYLRITRAGGQITEDGRVNGGLNLSRALGDHRYKQNEKLNAEDQMISPKPDIQTLELTDKDSFMVIACDGIWNSMSSQEVCIFIADNMENNIQLSIICEKLFDMCLAPDTTGDGTGCDNMTCIIVNLKYKNEQKRKSENSSEELKDIMNPDTKKQKLDL